MKIENEPVDLQLAFLRAGIAGLRETDAMLNQIVGHYGLILCEMAKKLNDKLVVGQLYEIYQIFGGEISGMFAGYDENGDWRFWKPKEQEWTLVNHQYAFASLRPNEDNLVLPTEKQ